MEAERQQVQKLEGSATAAMAGGVFVAGISFYSLAIAKASGNHRLFPTWVGVMLVLTGAVIVFSAYQMQQAISPIQKLVQNCAELNLEKTMAELEKSKAEKKSADQGVRNGPAATQSLTYPANITGTQTKSEW